jgi:hypothetical protein
MSMGIAQPTHQRPASALEHSNLWVFLQCIGIWNDTNLGNPLSFDENIPSVPILSRWVKNIDVGEQDLWFWMRAKDLVFLWLKGFVEVDSVNICQIARRSIVWLIYVLVWLKFGSGSLVLEGAIMNVSRREIVIESMGELSAMGSRWM